MENLKQQVGSIIYNKRKEKGLTLKELGKLIGVTEATASRFENGNQNLTLETLERICQALDVKAIIKLE